MSGGFFNYSQRDLIEIVDVLDDFLTGKQDMVDLTPETLLKFKETQETLSKAIKMVDRIDQLLACDDSEETFHEVWEDIIDQ